MQPLLFYLKFISKQTVVFSNDFIKHLIFFPFLLLLVARLFTPKIASFYEEFYRSKGVKFVKGTVLTSFDFDSNDKVKPVACFTLVVFSLKAVRRRVCLNCFFIYLFLNISNLNFTRYFVNANSVY